MAITIEVSLWVEGMHFWKKAPEKVSYLRFPHRHRVKVVAGVEVAETDREVEFYTLQHEIRMAVQDLYEDETLPYDLHNFGERSCEQIAIDILKKVQTPLSYVSVSEDDENRSIVTKE